MNGSAGGSRASLSSRIHIQTNIPWHTPGPRRRSQHSPVSPARTRVLAHEHGAKGAAKTSQKQPRGSSRKLCRADQLLLAAKAGSSSEPRAGCGAAGREEECRDDKGLDCWAGTESRNRGGLMGGGHKPRVGSRGRCAAPRHPELGKRRPGTGRGEQGELRECREEGSELRCPRGSAVRGSGAHGLGDRSCAASAAEPLRALLPLAPAVPPLAPAEPPLAPAVPPLPETALPRAHGASPSPAHREHPPGTGSLRLPRAPGAVMGTGSLFWVPRAARTPAQQEPPPGTGRNLP